MQNECILCDRMIRRPFLLVVFGFQLSYTAIIYSRVLAGLSANGTSNKHNLLFSFPCPNICKIYCRAVSACKQCNQQQQQFTSAQGSSVSSLSTAKGWFSAAASGSVSFHFLILFWLSRVHCGIININRDIGFSNGCICSIKWLNAMK